MAGVALHHARQHCPRHAQQAGDIGIDHGFPVTEVGAMGGLQPQRQPRTVDQHVDVTMAVGQRGEERVHGVLPGHIQRRGVDTALPRHRSGQGPQLVHTARRQDQGAAVLRKAPGSRLAETRRRPGDHDDPVHEHSFGYQASLRGRRVMTCPVMAASALATAGAMGGVPGSPTPEGALVDATMCTSTSGMASMRSTR